MSRLSEGLKEKNLKVWVISGLLKLKSVRFERDLNFAGVEKVNFIFRHF